MIFVFSFQQIYLYLPGELVKVTPVLILSAFPMAQNIVFPLAMMYPERLLSSHFYNDQQRIDAFHNEAKVRQSYYRSVLRDLLLMTSKNDDPAARKILSSILNDKETPTAQSILALKPFFSLDGPLHLRKLAAPHVKHLMKIHRVRSVAFLKSLICHDLSSNLHFHISGAQSCIFPDSDYNSMPIWFTK